MQTFLPYPGYRDSARCLNNTRLGNQRNEAMIILSCLLFGNGWSQHPATKMWKGYEYHLCLYGVEICNEWIRRGFRDNVLKKFLTYKKFLKRHHSKDPPFWMGNPVFHNSHKTALYKKDPVYYAQFKMVHGGYFWPKGDNERKFREKTKGNMA